MAISKRNKKLTIQFVEYMISGGAYFWVGYLVFFVADKGFHLTLWWAKLTANLVGWTINFLLQRFWVFKNPSLRGHMTDTSGRYIFITLVDFVLDYLIVASLKTAGITPYIGQFASSGFFTVWNYIWYRFWVFPEHYKQSKKPRKRR